MRKNNFISFEELPFEKEFIYKGKSWKRVSMFKAICLEPNNPFGNDEVTFEANTKIEVSKLTKTGR